MREKIAKAIKGKSLILKSELHDKGWYEVEVHEMAEIISITLHFYTKDIRSMSRFMHRQGYQLLTVIKVDFEGCTDGREFWWYKP